MKVELDEGKRELVIHVPLLPELRKSPTGKTWVVATTSGNIPSSVIINGKPLSVGVNAFISAK